MLCMYIYIYTLWVCKKQSTIRAPNDCRTVELYAAVIPLIVLDCLNFDKVTVSQQRVTYMRTVRAYLMLAASNDANGHQTCCSWQNIMIQYLHLRQCLWQQECLRRISLKDSDEGETRSVVPSRHLLR